MKHLRKSITQKMLSAAAAMFFVSLAPAQNLFTELRTARPAQHVNDYAQALDAGTVTRLEEVLKNLAQRTGINFVIVTVKSSGPQDLYDLSVELADAWNIGSRQSSQKSILLLIASENGRFYSQASPASQTEMTPGLLGYIGRRMRPQFEERKFGEGLITGLKAFVDVLGQQKQFSFADLERTQLPRLATTQSVDAGFKQAAAETVTENGSNTAARSRYAHGASAMTTALAAPVETESKRPPISNPAKAGRSPFPLSAEKASPVVIPRFKTRPAIDGRLNDPIWHQATVLKDFVQVQPGDNVPPSEPTEVLLGYDDQFLYVAFRAHDDPAKVRASVASRDRIFDDDTVGVILDTFNDKRKAYQLFFNPLGIQADAILTEGEGADSSVDIVMESKGTVTPDGYIVEVAIPFKSLRYEAGDGRNWGIHFQRHIKRMNDELDSWMPISRDESSYLGQAGHVTGLSGISQARTLEIIPTITVAQRARRVADIASPDGSRMVNHAPNIEPGLNVKFGIRPNVTASLTVNPDFADVEADNPVITANQRFPIFFEEKRPFFLEGVEIFRTPLQVVHTRTIVDPDVAGKLTGKVGRNTFGVLVASDAAPGNFSEDERNDPAERTRIGRFLDKNAYVGVLRLKRDFGRESSLGMIATSYDFVEEHNQTAGVDGRFRLDPQTVLSFQALGTTARRYFYDSDRNESVYRTGNGFGYYFNLERSKRHLYVGLNGQGRTRDYVADVGFTRRTNTNYENLYLSYSSEPDPDARLTSWRLSNSLETNFDWQGRSQNWDNYSEFQLNFPRETYLSVSYGRGYERLFENEFGASRAAGGTGAFFGDDPERSTYRNGVSVSAGSTPNKKYSVYGYFGRTWGAFDYDFGAAPRFARVSPPALADPNAPLDPGPGTSTDASFSVTYHPAQKWRSSLSYTRSKLVRQDTDRVAYSDQIYSLHTDYQFTRFIFFRGRLDYDWLSSRVFGQLLLGWTPNPGTAFYVGYNDSLNYNGFNPVTGKFQRGLQRNERVFFIKASYLFRHSFE